MRRDPETRIMYAARNEIREINAFMKQEADAAITLLDWYRVTHYDLPDDEYRAIAFLRNGEYEKKRGSITLIKLMGEYAMSTPTETFMRKNGDQMSNDIARLRGTRPVITIEAEQGGKLSEPLIKQITGNNTLPPDSSMANISVFPRPSKSIWRPITSRSSREPTTAFGDASN